MARYDVKTVDEAVALAERFRAEGRYDFFRGQTQPWPLRSSMQRRSGATQLKAIEWLERFRRWLMNTDGLSPIGTDQDQATAVAQHYGLPTDFIDVTPEPRIAGFFALDGRDESAAEPCCLVCLNSRELARVWAERYVSYRRPEIIAITVANLWRLEAQQGAFLFCPYPDFEGLSPVDRIFFPASTPAAPFARHEIYPERKSALEILLDQFFQRRLIASFKEEFDPVMRTYAVASPAERYRADRFRSGTLDRLASWNEETLLPWRDVTAESWRSTGASWDVVLSVESAADPVGAGRDAMRVVDELFARKPEVRRHALRFIVRGLADDAAKPAISKLPDKLAQLWDGLRRLPYEPAEVAEGIGRCLALGLAFATLDASYPTRQQAEDVLRALGDEEIVRVEFGQDDKSYSRAFVAAADLRAIMRADLYERLTPDWADVCRTNIRELLFTIYAAEKLFEFRPLARLFATRLAPIQVHTRQGAPIVDPPGRLENFGLP